MIQGVIDRKTDTRLVPAKGCSKSSYASYSELKSCPHEARVPGTRSRVTATETPADKSTGEARRIAVVLHETRVHSYPIFSHSKM